MDAFYISVEQCDNPELCGTFGGRSRIGKGSCGRC